MRDVGLRPRKALGQHFLTRSSVLRRVADAAELSKGDTVVEIGPGLGGLTVELAGRARRVVAIELDETLTRHLRTRFAGTNVTIVQGDARQVDPIAALSIARAKPPYVAVGNLPYNVAQPILRHYLEATQRPMRLVVTVQAEVAENIVAKPGEMSLLSLSVQLYAEAKLLFRVPPSAFYPPPKVQSAVVRIDVSPGLRADVEDIDAFFRVARAGFGTRRKQLRNALAHGLGIDVTAASALLKTAGIDATRRAQELSIEEWASLARAWVAAGRPGGP